MRDRLGGCRLEAAGARPPGRLYDTAMCAASAAGDGRTALALLSRMRHGRAPRSAATYAAAIRACARHPPASRSPAEPSALAAAALPEPLASARGSSDAFSAGGGEGGGEGGGSAGMLSSLAASLLKEERSGRGGRYQARTADDSPRLRLSC